MSILIAGGRPIMGVGREVDPSSKARRNNQGPTCMIFMGFLETPILVDRVAPIGQNIRSTTPSSATKELREARTPSKLPRCVSKAIGTLTRFDPSIPPEFPFIPSRRNLTIYDSCEVHSVRPRLLKIGYLASCQVKPPTACCKTASLSQYDPFPATL